MSAQMAPSLATRGRRAPVATAFYMRDKGKSAFVGGIKPQPHANRAKFVARGCTWIDETRMPSRLSVTPKTAPRLSRNCGSIGSLQQGDAMTRLAFEHGLDTGGVRSARKRGSTRSPLAGRSIRAARISPQFPFPACLLEAVTPCAQDVCRFSFPVLGF